MNGILEFEGEYMFKAKWSGKGYDKEGKVIYELNNGNGTIIEYNEEGKISFEGEYMNEERNGKGKEYDDWDGDLIFEDEYLNGKRNGKRKSI